MKIYHINIGFLLHVSATRADILREVCVTEDGYIGMLKEFVNQCTDVRY